MVGVASGKVLFLLMWTYGISTVDFNDKSIRIITDAVLCVWEMETQSIGCLGSILAMIKSVIPNLSWLPDQHQYRLQRTFLTRWRRHFSG